MSLPLKPNSAAYTVAAATMSMLLAVGLDGARTGTV
jgi:hypothetical protein